MMRILSLALILSLIACNNSSDPKENSNTADSSGTENLSPDAGGQQVATAFPEIYQFLSAKDPSFQPSLFEEAGADSNRSKTLPLSKELKAYYPYFIYNSDSSQAIDLYSYNFLLTQKNGKATLEAGGPDTEVALVDLKDNTRKRVYFGGSSSAVLDAKWINDEEFFLMTGEMIDQKFWPAILKYNVRDNTLEHYQYKDTLNVNISEYHDKRITD